MANVEEVDDDKVPCYIFDIDGTIANCEHRVHHAKAKEWDEFFGKVHLDEPIPHMIDLYRSLSTKAQCVFVSGRNDVCREETTEWLRKHVVSYCAHFRLYMRRKNDRRADYFTKSDLLDQLLKDGFRPIMAFDDRDQVVRMWRERGIPCAQVAPGNF